MDVHVNYGSEVAVSDGRELRRSELAQYGDLVVIMEGFLQLRPAVLTPGGAYNNQHCSFKHDQMVGKPFGSRIRGKTDRNFVRILKCTPELWTEAMSTRTQIVHTPDISQVIFNLDLRPGSVVVESGTGSGSMTTSLARTIAPTGHVYSFEFNESRAKAAIEEFRRNRLDKLVTCQHGDAVGIGFPGVPAHGADAVFLDLPNPWDALENAVAVMKPGAKLCSYSPCIEQSQRCCKKLAELGFSDITTMTCLIRSWEIRDAPIAPSPMLPFGEFDSSRLTHADMVALKRAHGHDHDNSGVKEGAGAGGPGADTPGDESGDGPPSAKKARLDVGRAAPHKKKPKKDELPTEKMLAPLRTIRGHTAYLTFATLYSL